MKKITNYMILEGGLSTEWDPHYDELSKKVLMATKDAKLVHLEKKRFKPSKLVTFNNTMEIRESFKNVLCIKSGVFAP